MSFIIGLIVGGIFGYHYYCEHVCGTSIKRRKQHEQRNKDKNAPCHSKELVDIKHIMYL